MFGLLRGIFGSSRQLGLEVNRVTRVPGSADRSPIGSRALQVWERSIEIKGASVVVVRLARGRRSTDTTRTDLSIRVTLFAKGQPLTVQGRLFVHRSVGATDSQARKSTQQPDGRWPEPWL